MDVVEKMVEAGWAIFSSQSFNDSSDNLSPKSAEFVQEIGKKN